MSRTLGRGGDSLSEERRPWAGYVGIALFAVLAAVLFAPWLVPGR